MKLNIKKFFLSLNWKVMAVLICLPLISYIIDYLIIGINHYNNKIGLFKVGLEITVFAIIGAYISLKRESEVKTNELLREKENYLNNVQKIAKMGSWRWDCRTDDIEWSQEMLEIYKLDPKNHQALTRETLLEYSHPDDVEKIEQAITKALITNEPSQIVQRIYDKDGDMRYLIGYYEPEFDKHGNPTRVIGVVQDITERKKSEEMIKKNYNSQLVLNEILQLSFDDASIDEMLKHVLDAILSISWLNVLSKGCIFLVDGDEEILKLRAEKNLSPKHFNACAKVPFGKCICGKAAISKKIIFSDCISSEHEIKYEGLAPHGHYSIPIIFSNKVIGVIVLYVIEGYKSSKNEIAFLESLASTVAIMIKHKQSEEEKKKLWKQLLQSQKIDSLGRLTGGIAHDFNNILTAIIGCSELALLRIEDDHPVRERLKIIQNSGSRAANLTRQLLAFSRNQLLEKRVNNINCIIDDMSKMLRRLISEDVKVEYKLKKKIKNVYVDQPQIEQVIMNLVVNAQQAMPKGGELIIETDEVELGEEFTNSYVGLSPGAYIKILVSDTGIGMCREIQERIFEPFFTTKQESEGTGLGLSTVFGIVKQHNGYINVDSEEGKGTTFTVYIPVHLKKEIEVKKEKSAQVKSGIERILIVEDDSCVREVIKELLDGYETLIADGASEAIRLCNKYEGNIDLLLTDVIMPDMNGLRLSNEIKSKKPSIKTIFMTGYIENPVVKENILGQRMPLLKKPFTAIELLNKVRETLDEAY